MNPFVKSVMILSVLALAGCSERKSRDFFTKDGITVGTPAALGSGSYRIPLEFATKVVHSGQWIDSVAADITASDIFITANFTHSGGKSRYPGYVRITGATPGTYALKYRDPDGTLHTIGSLVLP
jgi:hypothetical protein